MKKQIAKNDKVNKSSRQTRVVEANSSSTNGRRINPSSPLLSESDSRAERIGLTIPGILAGRTFAIDELLSLLARTFNDGPLIDSIRAALWQKREVAQTKQRENASFRACIELTEMLLLARSIVENGDAFSVPFHGLARDVSYTPEDLMSIFCQAIYNNSWLLTEIAVELKRVDLAQTLVVAESYMQRAGFSTDLCGVAGDFTQPTDLQQQAWKITAVALDEQLAA